MVKKKKRTFKEWLRDSWDAILEESYELGRRAKKTALQSFSISAPTVYGAFATSLQSGDYVPLKAAIVTAIITAGSAIVSLGQNSYRVIKGKEL